MDLVILVNITNDGGDKEPCQNPTSSFQSTIVLSKDPVTISFFPAAQRRYISMRMPAGTHGSCVTFLEASTCTSLEEYAVRSSVCLPNFGRGGSHCWQVYIFQVLPAVCKQVDRLYRCCKCLVQQLHHPFDIGTALPYNEVRQPPPCIWALTTSSPSFTPKTRLRTCVRCHQRARCSRLVAPQPRAEDGIAPCFSGGA